MELLAAMTTCLIPFRNFTYWSSPAIQWKSDFLHQFTKYCGGEIHRVWTPLWVLGRVCCSVSRDRVPVLMKFMFSWEEQAENQTTA